MYKNLNMAGLGIIIVSFSIYFYNPTLLSQEVGVFVSHDESKAQFLSDEYFDELELQYYQTSTENKTWFADNKSKKIAAAMVIDKMMKDLMNSPYELKDHVNFYRFFDVFAKNIRRLEKITEEIHFFRNVLNAYSGAPSSLDEMITLTAQGKWKLYDAKYHKYNYKERNGAFNVKFVSSRAGFEEIYNVVTGELVTDPYNMGTYNFAPGSINPFKHYKHIVYDKNPWKKWGNVKEVSYQDIIQLQSMHGSVEAKNCTKTIEKWIKQRKAELDS